MNDYLNLDDSTDTAAGDFLSSDAGYLDLDDPPAPMEAPVPPAAPGFDTAPADQSYTYTDDAIAFGAGDHTDWIGDSGDDWLGGNASPAATSTAVAPAPLQSQAMAAPSNPAMHDLSVQAPLLEDVQRSGITVGGARGELSTLVLDVEVPVEVYFGDASLTVEEFLEMGPGSVVELDHTIDAPIELHVRGKLVARGQLVTINGNYGMRITDMVDGGSR